MKTQTIREIKDMYMYMYVYVWRVSENGVLGI